MSDAAEHSEFVLFGKSTRLSKCLLNKDGALYPNVSAIHGK